MWIEGFIKALSGTNVFWLLLGSAWGLLIGVLPALGSNFAVALMLPFTFGMDPAAAIIFLCAIHAACNYGDSITSILLNVPGGPGTVATCWDGYPLAQQGRGGEALGIATLSSFIGGVAVWLLLVLLVGPMIKVAIAFGAPEYFALMTMALGLVSVASKGETMKGIIMVCAGLALSTVGQDNASGTTYRFIYGIPWLESGIPVVVSTLGVFTISQVIVLLEEGGTVAKCVEVKDSILKGFKTTLREPLTLLRSGIVGAFVGVLPALGVSVAGIAAYFIEKKYSKKTSLFGKGAPTGLIAAECGKGSCVVGDLIPTFTLGVPGSVTGAILLAAMVILGVEPGPRFLQSGSLPYTVFAGLLLAQVVYVILGLGVGKGLCRVAYIPVTLLAPILTVLVFMGAYLDRYYMFDMLLALSFGVFAYVLGKLGYPVVCLILGLILGEITEVNFARSLAMSFGSYSIFYTRSIAVAMLAITALFLVSPYCLYIIRRSRRRIPSLLEESLESGTGNRGYKGEVILLLSIALLQVGFLYTARNYKPLVRVFPNVVNIIGLGCVVWRLLIIVTHVFTNRHLGGVETSPSPSFRLFRGYLSWWGSIGTMVGYIVTVYVFGFIIGSAVYTAVVILMTMGYQRWRSAILAGALVGVGVLFLGRIFHVLLPTGLVRIV